MTQSAAYASIPNDQLVENTLLPDDTTADLETSRVIFFAGDALTDREKYQMPAIKGAGGMYRPELKTLPYLGEGNGSRGMIYKCRLTTLSKRMIPEWDNMLPPGERKHWKAGFNQTVMRDGKLVQEKIVGFKESNLQEAKKGNFQTVTSGHLRYKERYPGTDIRKALQRFYPNGVGGVVEITALKGASPLAIREAQLFFFPDWKEVEAGTKELPRKIKVLEAHIKERKVAVSDQDWSLERKQKYVQIADQMLQSCALFRQSAQEAIEHDEITVKDSATKGNTIGHSHASETLLSQIDYMRKSDLITHENTSVGELAQEMREDRKARQVQADADAETRRIEAENKRMELMIEMKKIGIDPATVNGTNVTPTAQPISIVDQPNVGSVSIPEPEVDESEAITDELPPIAMHESVLYKGEPATVTGKYFGAYQLMLQDGTEVKKVKREEIELKPTPSE